MTKKLTNKDYFEILASLAVVAEDSLTDIINENFDFDEDAEIDVPKWIAHQIEMLDNRKAAEAKRRADKPADKLAEVVFDALTRSVRTAEEIFNEVVKVFPETADGKPLTVGMVRARLTKLAKEEKIEKIDVKVNDKTRKGYCLFETPVEG